MTTPITASVLAQYTKSIAALVAAVATSLLTIFGDGDIARVLTVIIAVAGVLAVYRFPNEKSPAEKQAELELANAHLPADDYPGGYDAAVAADPVPPVE